MILAVYLQNHQRKTKRLSLGFTLVEILVSMVVIGILSTLAIPSFTEILANMRVRSYANDLTSSVYLARSEAFKNNAATTLCASSDGSTCNGNNWNAGWIILSGANVVSTHNALVNGFQINDVNSLQSLSFQPTGIGATAASFKICKATPAPGPQERVLTINSTGKPFNTLTKTGVCP